MSERTVYNRLRGPAFRAWVEERRAEMVDKTVGQLARVAGRAVSELGKLLGSPSEDIRLQAVRMALTNTVKLREHAAAEDRSADHERKAREREERVAEIRSLNVEAGNGEGEPIDTVLVYLHAGETPREVEPPMRGVSLLGVPDAVRTMGIPPERSGDWPRGEVRIIGEGPKTPPCDSLELWDYGPGDELPTLEEWQGLRAARRTRRQRRRSGGGCWG